MRVTVCAALAVGFACTTSGSPGAASPPVTAGSGISIGGTSASGYTVSVDASVVRTTSQADARYLGVGAQAADSARLGGTAATSFQTTNQADARYLGAGAQAADSARLGGTAATTFVQKGTGGDIDLGAGRVVLTVNGKSSSVFGLYCGITATATKGALAGPGNTSGYVAGKAICEQTCGTPLAHMCTLAEMVKSSELASFAVPAARAGGWVSSGGMWQAQYATYDINDCAGWHDPGTASGASVFYLNNGGGLPVPSFSRCDQAEPILCCE